MQDSCEDNDFDIDYYFRCQLFEDETELIYIQCSVIVGRICEKSPLFNASQTSSKDFCLNKRIDFNYEDLNEELNLVNSYNKVDLITIEEEYFNDKNDYYATVKSITKVGLAVNYDNSKDDIDGHNDDDMQQNQEGELNSKCAASEFNSKCVTPSTPKKATCTKILSLLHLHLKRN